MAPLCIQGSAFLIAQRDLLGLVEAGRLTRAALERRLDPADLAQLDATPRPTSWYPISLYDRLLRLLLEVEGGGDPRYLVERARMGREASTRDALHQRLERAGAAARERARDWFERSGHVLAALPSAWFDRGAWRLSRDGARGVFTLEGSGVDLPPCVLRVVQGALEFAAEALAGSRVDVVAHAAEPGRVQFVGTEHRPV